MRDIKGYRLDRCFGASGCPHGTNDCGAIMEKAEPIFKQENLLDFLEKAVEGELKYHHEFRVSCADCPNACSQPQIKDVGIIGARKPCLTDAPCSLCRACVDACPDHCIALGELQERPAIDFDACMMCGKCIGVCPTATITEEKKGFRMMLGGRLGRHPRLAMAIPGILSETEVLDVLRKALAFYRKNSRNGTRFARIITPEDIKTITEKQG